MNKHVSLSAVVLACALSLPACGNRVETGVLVNTIGVSKKAVGPSSAEASSRDLLPGTLQRKRVGDVVGSPAPDEVVEDGRRRRLEIKSAEGTVSTLTMDDYIVDFAVVPKKSDGLRRLVVHTYPNPRGESTFVVMAPAENRELARWVENPPASRGVASGLWRGQPALFYMVRDELVVRTLDGGPLARLTIPGIKSFATIHVAALAKERAAFVLSGDGYTANHAVIVLNTDGTVAYHEQLPEHAFGMKASGSAFQVETRTRIWEYSIPD